MPTVLIADDDLGILLLLQTTLRNEGLRLLTASDGESALRIARQERPDLILMDWHMPRGVTASRSAVPSARTLIPRSARRRSSWLPAQAGHENTAMGFAAGATDYLTKPFVPPHVRTRVRSG